MYPYVPKILHAIMTAFACIILMLLGVRAGGRYQTVLNIGALIFGIITCSVLYMLIVRELDNYNSTIARLAEAYGLLDDEGRAALSFQFPTLRYRMKRGELRATFEDTNVPIEMFRLFLSDSNQVQIAPERDWATAERPRWAWTEIKLWLEDNSYIISDSAAGSHSWLWRGNSYQHMIAYWMAGRRLENLNAEAV